MKKPSLSDIRAYQKKCSVNTMEGVFLFDNCAYLLDLIERMGSALGHAVKLGYLPLMSAKEARALLEELKK